MAQNFELNSLFAREELKSATASGSLLAAPFGILCTLFAVLALYNFSPLPQLVLWASALTLASLTRLIHAALYMRGTLSDFNNGLHLMVTSLQGILWGSALMLLAPEAGMYSAAIMTIIVIGVSIGTMLCQLASPATWMVMYTPAIFLHSLYLYTSSSPRLFMLATLGLIFSILMAILSVRLKNYLIANVKYQESLKDKNREILDKNRRLFKLAHFDGLTGAANRKLMTTQAGDYLDSIRDSDRKCAFFHIDLDHFKHLNDTMGHAAGDELLRIVTDRLNNCTRENDIVARLGGDEFGVFITDLDNADVAEAIAMKMLNSLERPQRIHGALLNCRASVGIAFFPEHGTTISELMNNSDLALQAAKKMGRNNYRICTNGLQLEASRRMMVEGELRRALREDTIGYHFQPIIRTQDGRISGVEALMRMTGEGTTFSSAEDLVQVSSVVGLSDELSAVLFRSLETQGPKLFETLPELEKISINLTPLELRSMKPVSRLKGIFKRGRLRPEQIQVEITEQSVLERGADQARKAIDHLAEMGISIVMDDFGTGYSSLTHLKTLPISGVKIDKSFVHELVLDARDAAIVRSLVGMCKGLGLTVTAEGVEQYAQFETLRRLGVDYVQGHLFFKADSVEQLALQMEDSYGADESFVESVIARSSPSSASTPAPGPASAPGQTLAAEEDQPGSRLDRTG